MGLQVVDLARLRKKVWGYQAIAAATVLVGLANAEQSVADEGAKSRQFENAVGCAWIVAPIEIYPGAAPHTYFGKVSKTLANNPPPASITSENADWEPFLALMEEGKDRELVLSFVRPGAVPGFHEVRPIAFDHEGNRHKLKAHMAAGSKGIMLERWTSDVATLAASKVAFVGLEGLTDEGLRMRFEAAREQARHQGLGVLPVPIVGEPYRFTLTDVGGTAIDSESFRGKVVLLDFWASWCYPCMEKMPQLKELYDVHHRTGFEIIGINLDRNDAARDKAIQDLGISWKQAAPPKPDDIRELWCDAMELRAIPRLLLIDCEGILRADCEPSELEAHLKTLLAGAEP
jgi:thiol-disulfide isomerase/thioredoxin